MASSESDTKRHVGNDGTYVEITRVRTCQKALNRKYCTPWVRESAHIHLGPGPAKRLAEGIGAGCSAFSGTLASTGVGVAAAPWLLLVGGLVVIGYHALKNDDESLDLYLDNVHLRAGSARLPVSVNPMTCASALAAL